MRNLSGLRTRYLSGYVALTLLGVNALLTLSSCEETSLPPEEQTDIQFLTDQDIYTVGDRVQSILLNNSRDTLYICDCCDDHYVEAFLDGQWVYSSDLYASCEDRLPSITIVPGRYVRFPEIHTGHNDLCRQVPGLFRLRTRVFKNRQLTQELFGQAPMTAPFSVGAGTNSEERYTTTFSWFNMSPPGCESGVSPDVSEEGHLRLLGCYKTSGCIFVWLGTRAVIQNSVYFEVNLNFPKSPYLGCAGAQYSIDLSHLCSGDYNTIVRYNVWQGNSGFISTTWIAWQDTVRVE